MEAKYPTDVEDESQVLVTQIQSTCHPQPHPLATTRIVLPKDEVPVQAQPTRSRLCTIATAQSGRTGPEERGHHNWRWLSCICHERVFLKKKTL